MRWTFFMHANSSPHPWWWTTAGSRRGKTRRLVVSDSPAIITTTLAAIVLVASALILGSYQINRSLTLAASEDKEGYAHKARHGLQPTEEASAGLCFLPLLRKSELFIAAEEGDSIPFVRTADAYIALDVRSDSLGRSQLLIPDMLWPERWEQKRTWIWIAIYLQ